MPLSSTSSPEPASSTYQPNNRRKQMRLIHFACFAALAAFLLPAAVFGVDGVILIDQNKALAGNVTPGDTPGFPVTISQPGSYRLDSNLTVPDVNTTAIVIAADNVTIDLNGFAILGNNVCAFVSINGSISFSCIPGGGVGHSTGNGIMTAINQAHSNITIRNGTIQGMGAYGVDRSEEHTSELQSLRHLVCRLLLE